jgi:hypothetical protein
MTVALTEVRDILKRYRREKQAEAIARLIHLRTSDAAAFEQMITSDDAWAGAHSLWEVSLYEDAVHPRDVVKEDTRRFRDCFIRLIVAMEFEGLRHPRAETVMKTFITWNKLGR